jgi:hypothetical protein
MKGKASVTFTARPDRELLIMVHRKHRVGAIHWFRDEGRIREKGVFDAEAFRTRGVTRLLG